MLKDELLKKEYWDKTYNKMILKQGFKKEDKDRLWLLKEIDRDNIVSQLMSGTYKWSIPVKRLIAKSGKKAKRVVYIYNIEDRYILGVMYRAMSQYFRDKFSDTCFSYKTGVSTNDAIKHIKKSKTSDMTEGVKVDIHAYFNSVSRERVVEMLDELFSDEIGIKNTLKSLMLNYKVIFNGKETQEFKGLIPGCALGSFFANYCLADLDKIFDEVETDVVYARYSDDIIILCKTKQELDRCLDIVLEHIKMYGLTINPDKYTYFTGGESVEYLGLKLTEDGKIDISDHAKQKIKKQIHRWCRKGRMEIERDGKDFEKVATRIIRQLNNKNFKCMIYNESTFGWCIYAFRYITTIKSLIEIDFYTRDTLRAMKTGRHNKNNVKALNDKDLKQLGWVSLVDLYILYREDYDYYCEIVELT